MIQTGHEIDLSSDASEIVRILDARLLDRLDCHLFILAFVDGQLHFAVRALAQRLLELEPAVQGFAWLLLARRVAAAAAARLFVGRGRRRC